MTKKKDEWITVAQAAVIAGCSGQAVYLRARYARQNAKKEGRRWYVRRSWAESLVVGDGGSAAAAQIEGLKTRLAAAEKDRDAAVAENEKAEKEIQALKLEAIDDRALAKEWERKHTHAVRQESKAKKEIEDLKVRQAASFGAARANREIAGQRLQEIEALKLELQTYADTYAESKPPAVIDRLVAAVESAPLQTLMQIDQPRHAALRRVVGLWTAVQHAVESFTPGDSAQTTNNDDEVK